MIVLLLPPSARRDVAETLERIFRAVEDQANSNGRYFHEQGCLLLGSYCCKAHAAM